MDDDATVAVQDAADSDRYEITIDGERAGFAQYVRRSGRVVFTHTEIDPSYEGQGLGGRLVGAALADVRLKGEQIVPLCQFVASYVERHPDQADLVDTDLLAAFDRRAEREN